MVNCRIPLQPLCRRCYLKSSSDNLKIYDAARTNFKPRLFQVLLRCAKNFVLSVEPKDTNILLTLVRCILETISFAPDVEGKTIMKTRWILFAMLHHTHSESLACENRVPHGYVFSLRCGKSLPHIFMGTMLEPVAEPDQIL